jgi:hypothetical protein
VEIRIEKPYDAGLVLTEFRLVYRGTLVSKYALAATALASAAVFAILPGDTAGLVAVMIAIGVLALWWAVRLPRYGLKLLPAACRHDSVITLTDHAVRHEFPLMRSEMAWASFTRVVDAEGMWLLYFGPRSVMPVPKAGFTAAQDAEFRAFLRARETAMRG